MAEMYEGWKRLSLMIIMGENFCVCTIVRVHRKNQKNLKRLNGPKTCFYLAREDILGIKGGELVVIWQQPCGPLFPFFIRVFLARPHLSLAAAALETVQEQNLFGIGWLSALIDMLPKHCFPIQSFRYPFPESQ